MIQTAISPVQEALGTLIPPHSLLYLISSLIIKKLVYLPLEFSYF